MFSFTAVIFQVFPRNRTVTSEEPMTQWPLVDLKSIEAYLDLGQLAGGDTVYAHVDTKFQANDKLNILKETASQAGLSLLTASSGIGIPPASVHSVLKEDRNIPAILLSNFDKHFNNPFYHSIYDNATNYDQDKVVDHVAKVTETVVRFIYKMVGKSSEPLNNLKADKDLIKDLLKCYTVTAKCDMLVAVNPPPFVNSDKLPEAPWPQYVGVERSPNMGTRYTHRILAYLTSKPLDGHYVPGNCTDPGEHQSSSIYDFIYINGKSVPSWWNGTKEECKKSSECGYCLKTTAWLSEAVSPGKFKLL